MNFTVLGFGARGSLYTSLFVEKGVKLEAVCEIQQERLDMAGKLYNISKESLYLSTEEFFSKGKMADLCVVATQDEQHKEHALLALDAGYDVLLEKPIATSLEDCLEIYEKAKKLNKKVFICHVLRYAPFFSHIKKELDSAKYGNITNINLTENVATWHQAHSFVRGLWRKSPPSAPMIVAKCCHDLDIISWFVQSSCVGVSSMGRLGYFTRENAPKNSADRCLDCPVKDSCYYDAERFYITNGFDKGKTDWPINVLCTDVTRENLLKALRTGPYGRCVYKCDNNVVDRQVVNIEFANGIVAHLTMTAFSKECYRKLHISCEKGEIYGDTDKNILTFTLNDGGTKTIDMQKFAEGIAGHGGGDALLIEDIIAVFNKNSIKQLTSIENAIQSHSIGFAAEKSRLLGGTLVVPK